MGRMADTLPTVTSPEERGRVAVVSKVVAEPVADFSVPELLCQRVAEIPGGIQGQHGCVLLGVVGDQHLVASHACDVVVVCHVTIVRGQGCGFGEMVDGPETGTRWRFYGSASPIVVSTTKRGAG